MTYATQAALVGREPLTVVEIVMTTCGLTYGTSPCTATGGAGSECYNTRSTCQDTANFDSDGVGGTLGTTKTFRFVEPRANLPLGESWFPCLVSAQVTPQRIEPGKGLGKRQSVTITLQDFPHHDRGIDPYVANRSSVQGTLFRKFLARNQYYVGRTLKVLNGFIGSTFSWADFDTHNYVIDRIEGPDAQGRVRIVAKDVLKLAEDKRAQAPAPSTGKLSADITAAATSLTLDSGSGADYGTSGTVRVGSELITFTGRSTDTLTGLTRGTSGTEAAAHSTDDLVQLCLVYTAQNVRAVVDDLLTTYGNIPAAYIPTTDWDTERDTWLLGYTLTTVISKPTGVTKLLDELCEQCQLMLWWDDTAQEIKLKAVMPPRGALTAVGQDNVLADSVSVRHLQDDRLSQVWVYYNPIDRTEDDKEENYSNLYIAADTEAETAAQYGEKKVKLIKSRWLVSEGQAAATATRYLNRYRDYAKEVKFALDAKDAASVATGDTIELTVDQVADVTGAADTVDLEITEEREANAGTRWEFVGLQSAFNAKRYGFIAPASKPDYTSATQADKDAYAWVSNTTPEMSNGDAPYRII